MRWCCTVLALLLMVPASAGAEDLEALLVFIEEHNGRLRAQRQVFSALTAASPGNAEVLRVLEAEQQSWWKYARLQSGLGVRASPGDEGSGVDARIGVSVNVPLADYSGRLALARERQQQLEKQQTHQQQQDAAQLAYATLRAQIRAEVVAKLAQLDEVGTMLAAAQVQREARLAQQMLVAQRVEVGAESREKLWQMQDQLRDIERQIAVHASKRRQLQTEVALYGGEQWKSLWDLLDARNSWLPSAAR